MRPEQGRDILPPQALGAKLQTVAMEAGVQALLLRRGHVSGGRSGGRPGGVGRGCADVCWHSTCWGWGPGRGSQQPVPPALSSGFFSLLAGPEHSPGTPPDAAWPSALLGEGEWTYAWEQLLLQGAGSDLISSGLRGLSRGSCSTLPSPFLNPGRSRSLVRSQEQRELPCLSSPFPSV